MCDNNSEGGDRSTSLAVDYISDHNEPECLLECEDEEMYDKDLGENLSNDSNPRKEETTEYMTVFRNQYDKKYFQCAICRQAYTKIENLNRHLFKVHNINKGVNFEKCEYCDYKTARAENLKRHLLQHKAGDSLEIFRCDTCQYTTHRKDHMQRHVKTHTKIMNYSCTLCSYKTPFADYLKKHVIRHKNRKNPENFSCLLCDYTTTRKECLSRHKKSHLKSYKCEQCDFQCGNTHELKKHKLIVHKGISDLINCDQCDYVATRKDHLKRHLTIHLTDPVGCPKGDFKTVIPKILKRHIKQEHRQNLKKKQIFKCFYCDYEAEEQLVLTRHFENEHKNEANDHSLKNN